jgi:putative endonuclease
MSDRSFFVYILASKRNGTLCVCVTNDLARRVWEHKQGLVTGFTMDYKVHLFVFFEAHETAEAAIAREKRLKRWHRRWKLELIEASNPTWRDLYPEIAAG